MFRVFFTIAAISALLLFIIVIVYVILEFLNEL